MAEHDAIFLTNRRTPKIVKRGERYTPKPSEGKIVKRRRLTADEEKVIARGDWLRVNQRGEKPGDSGYMKKRSKVRPQLGAGLTAANQSWRWQLRDRYGRWIEMGAEVKWLAKGRWMSGVVVDSPNESTATVEESSTKQRMDIPTASLEVIDKMLNAIEGKSAKEAGLERGSAKDVKAVIDWNAKNLAPAPMGNPEIADRRRKHSEQMGARVTQWLDSDVRPWDDMEGLRAGKYDGITVQQVAAAKGAQPTAGRYDDESGMFVLTEVGLAGGDPDWLQSLVTHEAGHALQLAVFTDALADGDLNGQSHARWEPLRRPEASTYTNQLGIKSKSAIQSPFWGESSGGHADEPKEIFADAISLVLSGKTHQYRNDEKARYVLDWAAEEMEKAGWPVPALYEPNLPEWDEWRAETTFDGTKTWTQRPGGDEISIRKTASGYSVIAVNHHTDSDEPDYRMGSAKNLVEAKKVGEGLLDTIRPAPEGELLMSAPSGDVDYDTVGEGYEIPAGHQISLNTTTEQLSHALRFGGIFPRGGSTIDNGPSLRDDAEKRMFGIEFDDRRPRPVYGFLRADDDITGVAHFNYGKWVLDIEPERATTTEGDSIGDPTIGGMSDVMPETLSSTHQAIRDSNVPYREVQMLGGVDLTKIRRIRLPRNKKDRISFHDAQIVAMAREAGIPVETGYIGPDGSFVADTDYTKMGVAADGNAKRWLTNPPSLSKLKAPMTVWPSESVAASGAGGAGGWCGTTLSGMRSKNLQRAILTALVAGGESWKWQLRDADGKWIEMGAIVSWFYKGAEVFGEIIGSPSEGVARVRRNDNGKEVNLFTSSLRVDEKAARAKKEAKHEEVDPFSFDSLFKGVVEEAKTPSKGSDLPEPKASVSVPQPPGISTTDEPEPPWDDEAWSAIIDSYDLAELRQKVAKINDRAVKKGLTGRIHVLARKTDGGKWEVQTQGRPKLDSKWELAAVIDGSKPESAIVNRNPNAPDEIAKVDIDKSMAGHCDYCNTNRDRKTTYVLRGATGETKYVGSSCLADFLGHSVALGKNPFDTGEEDIDGWLGEKAYLPSGEVLFQTIRVVDKFGFRKTSELVNTRDMVDMLLHGGEYKFGQRYGTLPHLTDADKERIRTERDEVLEWARAGVSITNTDYRANLGAALSDVVMDPKYLGLVVSAITSYRREKQKLAEKKAKLAAIKQELVSPVGTKITKVPARIVGISKIETKFGISTKITFYDKEGHRIVWWASNPPANLNEGDEILLTGKVKKEDTYGGGFSTIITHGKIEPNPVIAASAFAPAWSGIFEGDAPVLAVLVAAGDSWRWQLRDRYGKWIEMGAEVKWLARGRWLQGIVVGSPREGVATVEEKVSHKQMDLPTNSLEITKNPDGSSARSPKSEAVLDALQSKSTKAALPDKTGPGGRPTVGQANELLDIIEGKRGTVPLGMWRELALPGGVAVSYEQMADTLARLKAGDDLPEVDVVPDIPEVPEVPVPATTPEEDFAAAVKNLADSAKAFREQDVSVANRIRTAMGLSTLATKADKDAMEYKTYFDDPEYKDVVAQIKDIEKQLVPINAVLKDKMVAIALETDLVKKQQLVAERAELQKKYEPIKTKYASLIGERASIQSKYAAASPSSSGPELGNPLSAESLAVLDEVQGFGKQVMDVARAEMTRRREEAGLPTDRPPKIRSLGEQYAEIWAEDVAGASGGVRWSPPSADAEAAVKDLVGNLKPGDLFTYETVNPYSKEVTTHTARIHPSMEPKATPSQYSPGGWTASVMLQNGQTMHFQFGNPNAERYPRNVRVFRDVPEGRKPVSTEDQKAAKREWGQIQRDVLSEVISGIRGKTTSTKQTFKSAKYPYKVQKGHGSHKRNLKPDEVEMLRDSLMVYPQEWVDAMDDAKSYTFSMRTRGFQQYESGHIAISDYSGDGAVRGGDMHGTAVHEFGHSMEHSVPGLKQLEEIWWHTRAIGREKQDTRPTVSVSKADGGYYPKKAASKTKNSYTMKAYRNSNGEFYAFEIVTTAMQDMFGEVSGTYVAGDDDLKTLVLGALVTL
jgi:hypothetical protein